MKKILFVLIFGFVISAQAANICVGPSATGDGSGSNWNNIKSWSGMPVRGDTWYLMDGAYGAKSFNTPVSGTTPITIRKATPGEHGSSVGWPTNNSYGDGQATFTESVGFNTSFWVFDGVTGSGSNKSEYGFAILPSGGDEEKLNIYDSGGNAATFDGITLRHVSVTCSGSNTTNSQFGIWQHTQTRSRGTTLQYLHIDNCQVAVQNIAGSGWLIDHNYFARQWSGSASSSLHGTVLQNGNGGGASGSTFSNNIVQQCDPICIEDAKSWDIFGNVFMNKTSSNGILHGAGGALIANVNFHNNTMVNSGPAFMNTGSGNVARNNLFYNSSRNSIGSGGVESNNVLVSAADQFLDASGGNFRLSKETSAGTTLASPFNLDMDGKNRGEVGVWDIGAYEFGGTPQANNYHPADTNLDFLMGLNEATAFGACWKTSCTPEATLDYAVRAGTLWNATPNGQYQYNSAHACPLCWEVMP